MLLTPTNTVGVANYALEATISYVLTGNGNRSPVNLGR